MVSIPREALREARSGCVSVCHRATFAARLACRRLLLISAGVTACPLASSGQSVLDRSPNVSGDWAGAPGTVYFHFLHRFTHGSAPARKVTSSPTLLLAAGLAGRTMVGFHYATNSDLTPAYPNEWEFFARYAAAVQGRHSPVDVAVQGGYNLAAESVDGELTLGRRVGQLRLLVAGRVLSDAFGRGEARTALAGGGILRLGRFVALAADVASVFDQPPGYEAAWSAALQIAIPYTPHTLSLQATNTNTATLQGASASRDGRTRYGFEFTIPITIRRYLPRSRPRATRRDGAAATAATDVRVVLRDDVFAPTRIEIAAGTTIVWANEGARAHSVTADDERWDSGPIQPGDSWRHTFDRPGTYAVHCAPHPLMTAIVVVR